MQGCVLAGPTVGHMQEDLLQGSGWVSSFCVTWLGLSSQGILLYLFQHDGELLPALTMLLHQQGRQIGNLQYTWDFAGTRLSVGIWVVLENQRRRMEMLPHQRRHQRGDLPSALMPAV